MASCREAPVGHVSRHYVAVIDSVVHDNHDLTRAGDRCVRLRDGWFESPAMEKIPLDPRPATPALSCWGASRSVR
jgi:hypothetical protein